MARFVVLISIVVIGFSSFSLVASLISEIIWGDPDMDSFSHQALTMMGPVLQELLELPLMLHQFCPTACTPAFGFAVSLSWLQVLFSQVLFIEHCFFVFTTLW